MTTEKTFYPNKHVQRNVSVDYMRTIGTLLVMLAHVTPPAFIANLRCFDVVALVFISGMCISVKKYGSYLIKRFKRLVLPTWITMTVLFILTALVCYVLHKSQIYSALKIVKAYLFLKGSIGYIWIVRIYLMIAVCSPLIIKVSSLIKNDYAFTALTVGLLLICNFITAINDSEIIYYFSEAVMYSTVASWGYRYKKSRNNCWVLMLSVSLVLFAVSLIKYGFIPNDFKYPPQLPYISYGIFVTLLLLVLCEKTKLRDYLKNIKISRCFVWLSKESFNIYLIHIIVLSVLNAATDFLKLGILAVWWIKYVILTAASVSGCIVLDCMRRVITTKCTKRTEQK